MPESEVSVSERIKDLYQHFGDGNLSAFSRQVGVSAQAIRDLMKGEKGGPSWPLLQNLLQAFPAINTEWLLLGQGEMLKPPPPAKNSALHSPSIGVEPRVVAIAEGDNTAAPLYNIRTAANYKGDGLSQERPEPDGIVSLPRWLLRHGNYAVFPVVGDSMEPTFYARDYVLCRFLPKTEWDDLREDAVAVIVSESRGLQLKRLTFRLGEGYVRCKSDNRQHPYYQLDLDDVLEVWRFEWRITSSAHNPTEGLAERVSTVEDSLEDMRALLEQVLDKKELRFLESKQNHVQ
jgi:phage repressor protein C with HTH and peptisase S24 domain